MSLAPQDRAGQTFGQLTFVRPSERGPLFWFALCACGTMKEMRVGPVVQGTTKSCGCLRRERGRAMFATHGLSRGARVEAAAFRNMRERCNNTRSRAFKDYGGRGIGVCEGFGSFEHFLRTLGRRPADKTSIDRIDNNGWYSCGACGQCVTSGRPMNCRWATAKVQGRNRRSARIVEIRGRAMSVVEWLDELKLASGTFRSRLRLGMTHEQALLRTIDGTSK